MARSWAKAGKVQAGNMRSTDLKRARRTDGLLRDIVALLEQKVMVVMCVHDGSEVGLQWVQRENSESEGREIVYRRAAVLACDPAPLLSQTPRRSSMSVDIGVEYFIV